MFTETSFCILLIAQQLLDEQLNTRFTDMLDGFTGILFGSAALFAEYFGYSFFELLFPDAYLVWLNLVPGGQHIDWLQFFQCFKGNFSFECC